MVFARFLKNIANDSNPSMYAIRIIRKARTNHENVFKTIFKDLKETVCEDAPITSHIYKAGEHDGQKKGRAEQAETDSKKFDEMNAKYQEDANRWRESDQAKDDFIRRQQQHINEQDEVIDSLSDKQ